MPCSNCGRRGHNQITCSFGSLPQWRNKCSKGGPTPQDHYREKQRKIEVCWNNDILPSIAEEMKDLGKDSKYVFRGGPINIKVDEDDVWGVTQMYPLWTGHDNFAIKTEAREGRSEFWLPLTGLRLEYHRSLESTLVLTYDGGSIQFEVTKKNEIKKIKKWFRSLQSFIDLILTKVDKVLKAYLEEMDGSRFGRYSSFGIDSEGIDSEAWFEYCGKLKEGIIEVFKNNQIPRELAGSDQEWAELQNLAKATLVTLLHNIVDMENKPTEAPISKGDEML